MNKMIYIFDKKVEKQLGQLIVDFYYKTGTLTTDTENHNGYLALSIWKNSEKADPKILRERVKVLEGMFKESKLKPIQKIKVN